MKTSSSMRELTDLSIKRESSRDLAPNSSRNTPLKQSSQRNLPPIVEPINLLAEDIKQKPPTDVHRKATERPDFYQIKDLEQPRVTFNEYSYEEYNKHRDNSALDQSLYQQPYPPSPAKQGHPWLDAKKPVVEASPVRSLRDSSKPQAFYGQPQAAGDAFLRQARDASASPGPSYLRSSSHQQLSTPPRRDERVASTHQTSHLELAPKPRHGVQQTNILNNGSRS